MKYFELIASFFARPGIPRSACLAAAMAITAKELIARNVRLRAPNLFEPDLTCGSCFINCPPTGRSRLFDAVQDLQGVHFVLASGPFRRLGSLVLWEVEELETTAQARKMRKRAEALTAKAFDSPHPEMADVLLVVGRPGLVSECDEELSCLSVRSVTVPCDNSDKDSMVRDLESAQRVQNDLRQYLQMLSEPILHFSDEAQDMLLEVLDYEIPKLRHRRVKMAKLAALFSAGRQTLDGGSEMITADDVAAARDLILAGEDRSSGTARGHGVEEKEADNTEEEIFLRRILRKHGGPTPAEIPMSVLQTTVRRSRRPSSKPVNSMLEELARRGRLQIVRRQRLGPSKGRPSRVVIIQPTDDTATRLALPSPAGDENQGSNSECAFENSGNGNCACGSRGETREDQSQPTTKQ